MTHAQLRQAVKDALKNGEEVQLTVLRGLLAACTNDLVAKSRKPTEELSEEEITAIIRRGAKQRRESIDQFFKANRGDLASKETAELMFLETLLPPELPAEEIEKRAREKAAELGITDKSKANQLMGALMKDLKGQADGNVVKAVIDKLFA